MKTNDLPECQYRRHTKRPGLLRLHCFLQRADCTPEECQECSYATPEIGQQRTFLVDGVVMHGRFNENPDPNRLAVEVEDKSWVVDHSTDAVLVERPDLQAIRTSLPRQRGKHRKFTIETDGSIVYTQEEGEWEPPKDINGYRRDPMNPWRFTPLWLKCMKRTPKGTRTKACGCIQLTMVCDNPASELHTKTVSDAECQQCSVRQGE